MVRQQDVFFAKGQGKTVGKTLMLHEPRLSQGVVASLASCQHAIAPGTPAGLLPAQTFVNGTTG